MKIIELSDFFLITSDLPDMAFIEKISRLQGGCFKVKNNQASLYSYVTNIFSFLSFTVLLTF